MSTTNSVMMLSAVGIIVLAILAWRIYKGVLWRLLPAYYIIFVSLLIVSTLDIIAHMKPVLIIGNVDL